MAGSSHETKAPHVTTAIVDEATESDLGGSAVVFSRMDQLEIENDDLMQLMPHIDSTLAAYSKHEKSWIKSLGITECKSSELKPLLEVKGEQELTSVINTLLKKPNLAKGRFILVALNKIRQIATEEEKTTPATSISELIQRGLKRVTASAFKTDIGKAITGIISDIDEYVSKAAQESIVENLAECTKDLPKSLSIVKIIDCVINVKNGDLKPEDAATEIANIKAIHVLPTSVTVNCSDDSSSMVLPADAKSKGLTDIISTQRHDEDFAKAIDNLANHAIAIINFIANKRLADTPMTSAVSSPTSSAPAPTPLEVKRAKAEDNVESLKLQTEIKALQQSNTQLKAQIETLAKKNDEDSKVIGQLQAETKKIADLKSEEVALLKTEIKSIADLKSAVDSLKDENKELTGRLNQLTGRLEVQNLQNLELRRLQALEGQRQDDIIKLTDDKLTKQKYYLAGTISAGIGLYAAYNVASWSLASYTTISAFLFSPLGLALGAVLASAYIAYNIYLLNQAIKSTENKMIASEKESCDASLQRLEARFANPDGSRNPASTLGAIIQPKSITGAPLGFYRSFQREINRQADKTISDLPSAINALDSHLKQAIAQETTSSCFSWCNLFKNTFVTGVEQIRHTLKPQL